MYSSLKGDLIILALSVFTALLLCSCNNDDYRDEPTAGVNESTTLVTTEETELAENITDEPVDTVKDDLEGLLELELDDGEFITKDILSEQNLLYALKTENQVLVYNRDLQTGIDTLLFNYEEYSEYEGANRSCPPDLALSPNGRKVVFTDKEGLKVYYLKEGQLVKYIYKMQEEIGDWDDPERTPAVWSEAAMNVSPDHYWGSIVVLSEPRWSFDGNYFSFNQMPPNGDSRYGLYDIKNGRYMELPWGCDLCWSPVENAYLLSRCDYGGGFFKADQGDLTNPVRLFENAINAEEAFFYFPAYSANGSMITFLYSPDSGNTYNLGLAKADGTGFVEVEADLLSNAPFFSINGDRLFFFEQVTDRQVLTVYELQSGMKTRLLVMPAGLDRWHDARWTAGGFLALTGNCYHDYTLTGSRFIIINPNGGNLVFASSLIEGYVTFAGFNRQPF
jgi:hypothetical protein